ncbi:MAG: hypothetical protein COT74_01600 [Bdellovibrionales bacterium CG10_big_fil_rev_8_21_14_0_10_45_34]|nr:MAG: hypothetical protein COT74_01600 [Bdellovibrionales bacterium CG10_big_fil_rev_8_21_14_0_10_45_34]
MGTIFNHSISPKKSEVVSPKQSILVIDDSSDTLELHQIVLGSAGFDVIAADSGEKALQLLLEIDEPNLIILDMQIGDMNGLEFLNLLEKVNPEIVQHVPVVFLTGMSEVPKSKAIGFIRKPADNDGFLKAVNHFIEIGQHAPYKRK